MLTLEDRMTATFHKEETQTGKGKVAHYAKRTKVTEGYVLGTPLEALCGKIFVPTQNPESLAVCGECKAVYDDDEAINLARGSM